MTDSRQMSVSKVQDEGRLAELGYAQELRREWSLLHNFGVSFSIIVGVRIVEGESDDFAN